MREEVGYGDAPASEKLLATIVTHTAHIIDMVKSVPTDSWSKSEQS